MELPFLKMHGCGEDVVVVDAARIPADAHARLPAIARRVLHRGFGVGGSALLILGAGDDGLTVRSFWPDGTERAPSCNALRCVARYASDSGRVHSADFCISAGAGPQRAQIIDSANVRIDMGEPVDAGTRARIRESARDSFTREITVDGRGFSYTPVAIPSPWAVFFVPDFSIPLRRTARKISSHPDFPADTGIGFVLVVSRDELRLRCFGGSADDCACASAALVASVVNGFTDREVFVRLRGGELYLQWDESDGRMRVTGPAVYVFTGTYDDPEDSSEGPA